MRFAVIFFFLIDLFSSAEDRRLRACLAPSWTSERLHQRRTAGEFVDRHGDVGDRRSNRSTKATRNIADQRGEEGWGLIAEKHVQLFDQIRMKNFFQTAVHQLTNDRTDAIQGKRRDESQQLIQIEIHLSTNTTRMITAVVDKGLDRFRRARLRGVLHRI